MKHIQSILSSKLFVVLSLLIIGSIQAYGNSNKDYYSKVTVTAVPTGAGKVYAAYGSNAKSENEASSGKDSQSSAPTHNYTLSYEENTGWKFKGWYDNSGCTGNALSGNSVSVTAAENVDNATTNYYAKFVELYKSSVTVVASEGGSAIVNGNSSTTDSESNSHSYSLIATANSGYQFMGWYSDDTHLNSLSKAPNYTHIINAIHLQENAEIIYALFMPISHTPSILGEDRNEKVGETVSAGYSFANVSNEVPDKASNGTNFYYTITHNITSSQTNPDHPNEVVAYDAATNQLIAYNAGTATITFTQNQTSNYDAASVSFNVSVSKRENSISLQGYTGNTLSVSYGRQYYIVSTNDATRPEFVVTPISGGEHASYHENNGSPYIQSNFTKGTAVLKVSQAEDYKYNAAETNLTINVAQAEPTVAYVYYNEAGGSQFTGGTSESMALSGPADKLYFDTEFTSGAINKHIKPQYSVDGSNWTDIVDVTGNGSYGPYDLSNTDAKYIRFNTTGSLTQYYRNIKVTRKLYFNASTNSLDFNVYDGDTEQKTFTVDWSISNGGEIKVYSDNPDFTVSPTGFGNGDNADGKNTVTVTYKEAEGSPNTANGHIYVYNDVNCHEIAVTGLTKWKADPDKRYSLQSGSNNVTVTGTGATELMEQKSHLLQAFAFEEQDANKYGVKYDDEAGSEHTLYPTVTTIKENGKWKATVGGTVMGDIIEAGKYDCAMTIKENALWGTFIAPYRVQMPSGVKAYTCAYSITGDIVVTEQTGSELEANVPYLIKSDNAVSQTYSNYGCAAQDAYTSQSLTGTYTDYQTVAGDYVLQKHESGTGFYLVYDVMPIVKPSRCYIAASPSNKSRAYILGADGNTTMIENIEDTRTQDNDTLYTINGIKVTDENPAPGIYIRNGKKVVIK